MTKGLFTSTEEIRFHDVYVMGHIESVAKSNSKNQREIRQDNRRIAQNLKRLNQTRKQSFIRGR